MSASQILDVVMPIEEGRAIPGEVVEALVNQDIPLRLWISTLFSSGRYADARNQVKQYGQSGYVFMLDNDIVMPHGALKGMIEFLDTHSTYGAIGLCKNPRLPFKSSDAWLHAEHVDMSCVLFRKEVLEAITFADIHNAALLGRMECIGLCECANACRDIRKIGYEIGFLPDIYAIHLRYATFKVES